MRLGELERAVLDVLWHHDGGLFARDIVAVLPAHPAPTTILTVLDRLSDKRLVTRVKDGRAHRYQAAASKEAFLATAMRTALVEADDRDAVLSHFVGTVSEQDAAALRSALDQLERASTDEDNPGKS